MNKLSVLRTFKRGRYRMAECLCVCGNKTTIRYASLSSGNTKSCGCLRAEHLSKIATTHGLTAEHKNLARRWSMMLDRCRNPNNKSYKNYGGRGITVCERWYSFENFFVDMGKPPTPGHTIERVKNNEGYCPDNCIWLPQKYQGYNTRRTKRL